jgi:organic radical activating enzyme
MLTIDIELTNRCNATCAFCPRDVMPRQGLMAPEVFEQSLARAVEFAAFARRLRTPLEITVVFCGTGEPLVHRRAAEWVGRVRDAGLACQVSTNGALLSQATSLALLDAGLGTINVNASDLDADYERVYALPFATTRDNVERFVALSRGRCVVNVVLVDHRRDPAHLRTLAAFWRARGVDHVLPFGLVNRAGAVRLPAAALPDAPDDAGAPRPLCAAPFMHLFVGWDGRYYLCSSDWRKEVPFGSVFDASFADITAAKLVRVASREPICTRCTLDPANLLRRRRHVVDATRSRPFEVDTAELLDNDRRARALASDVIAALEAGFRSARPAPAA